MQRDTPVSPKPGASDPPETSSFDEGRAGQLKEFKSSGRGSWQDVPEEDWMANLRELIPRLQREQAEKEAARMRDD